MGERPGGLNLMGSSFTASEDILYYSRIICQSSECTGACGDIESHFVPSSVTFCPSSTPTEAHLHHHHYRGIYSRDGRFSVHRHSNRGKGRRRDQIRHRLHTRSRPCLCIHPYDFMSYNSNGKRDLCLTHRRHSALGTLQTKPNPERMKN